MATRYSSVIWVCLFLLLVGGLELRAQHASAAGDPSPSANTDASSAVGAMDITLGNSAVELFGPWRFHTGDDPAWASPALDDSHWGTIDLTPPVGTADSDLGTSGFIPGWTATGYPGYSGFAWYRLRVHLTGVSKPLSLRMPTLVDDAYQVFVNGHEIGSFGHFSARSVTAYNAVPGSFDLPPSVNSGTITIAVRMWMDSATRFLSPDAGGMHGPPSLGHAPVISTQVQMDWDSITHEVGSGFLETLILLLALAVALTHFWIDRSDRAYLWLGLVSLATLLGNAVLLAINYTSWIPQELQILLTDVVAAPLRIGLWVLFWAYWFHVGPARWLQRAVWALVLALALGTALVRPPLFGQTVPVHLAHTILPVLVTLKLALGALLVWVTWRGIRRNRAEGLLALPAVLLAVMANYQHELHLLHIPIRFTLLGYQVSLGTASTILSLLLVTLMLSRRFLRSQRVKIQWKLEIQQAREVQQVLIPRQLPSIPGLLIESEYRPAREVGGDFFQIIPTSADGDALFVVGDVTGKGMRAGMLVALIVGVIRTAAGVDPDPHTILSTLNSRLCERSETSATCLILHLTATGRLTLVNAGHLPPYLNGRELPMEGSLPLGILPDADLPVATLQLADGDVLTLLSDGVVEAQNSRGELFGFERIQQVLATSQRAVDLALAAERFGQEDDILVLRIERCAAALGTTHEHTQALAV